MWFRNLLLYRLNTTFDPSAEHLHEQLQAGTFRACGSLEMSSMGWDRPLGRHGHALTHAANGCIMVCARIEEKVLPQTVVREILDERVDEIETEQMRRVPRKERLALRDEILQDLLPKAFTRSSHIYTYIAPHEGWLVVNASSVKKAEEVLTLLRKSLGSLPATPLDVNTTPAAVMTGWLQGQGLPGDFVLGDECELRDPSQDGGIVRCRRQDLGGEEIQTHLQAGKQVARLAVEWNERLACVLGDDLAVRRLRFLDVVQEEAKQTDAGDAAARFDADFALMTLELSRFILRLVEVFGGEQSPAAAA
jgi:recombination associated protein RdgC